MVAQGVLPYQYQEDSGQVGVTGLAGLPVYLDLAHVVGLRESIGRHVGLRAGSQGWTDAQMVTSLLLLNLAGGDCVEDIEKLGNQMNEMMQKMQEQMKNMATLNAAKSWPAASTAKATRLCSSRRTFNTRTKPRGSSPRPNHAWVSWTSW